MSNKSLLYHYARKRFIVPFRLWCYSFFRLSILILVFALLANFIFSYFFYTPKMWELREVNIQTIAEYNNLREKINQSMQLVQDIRDREVNQYRSIFSIDTLHDDAYWVKYPQSYYDAVGYGRYAELMIGTEQQLNFLSQRTNQLSHSLDEVEMLASNKDVMMEHLPTLWPLDRTKMKKLGKYGPRMHPILRVWKMHDGIDMSGPTGLPIYATGNGVIAKPVLRGGYGLQVLLDHQFGYKTRYAHLSKILVKEGQSVKRGDVIGLLGNTGRSSGPHLHYEIIHKGQHVNPINYLNRDMSSEEFEEIVKNARTTTFELD